MPKLYEITGEHSKLMAAIEENNGEISDHMKASLEVTGDEFEKKVINTARVIKNLGSDQAAFKAEGDRLLKKAKSIGSSIEWLENRIKIGMKLMKTNEVKGEILTIKTRPSPPSCIVLSVDAMPPVFTKLIPEHREADRNAVIKHYKERDEIVPGTDISVGTTLTIR